MECEINVSAAAAATVAGERSAGGAAAHEKTVAIVGRNRCRRTERARWHCSEIGTERAWNRVGECGRMDRCLGLERLGYGTVNDGVENGK